MRVTLSAAVTADGYMDDDSPRRLIISTPGDWEEVYRLRAAHDAILAGAETLRRDDPSLLVRDQAARARRVQAGLKPDIAKVTLTRSGGLSPRLRFFTAGDADRYVFSPGEITGLQNIATVISTSEAITAKYIVTELEKRGIERLMVEGGAEVLRMFLDEGMADTLRLAVNPRLRLGGRGGASLDAAPLQSIPHTCEQVDGMEVTTYTLHPDTTGEDLRYLRMAVDEGRKCTPSPTSYCVQVTRTKLPQRTTPSRRPSPRRWRQAPCSAAPRCTPRWSRARVGRASPKAAHSSLSGMVSPGRPSHSMSPTVSSAAAER